MKLNLHLHVEEVQEVVETAQMEKKIEKKLGDISGAWAVFELEQAGRGRRRVILRHFNVSGRIFSGTPRGGAALRTRGGSGRGRPGRGRFGSSEAGPSGLGPEKPRAPRFARSPHGHGYGSTDRGARLGGPGRDGPWLGGLRSPSGGRGD